MAARLGRGHFSVGVLSDFAGSREMSRAALLGGLDAAGMAWQFVEPGDDGTVHADFLSRHAAFLVGNSRIDAGAISGSDPAPLLLARFGVGTDGIDLTACSASGVMVSITPDSMARPVAVAALAHVLAATLNLPAKDAIVRHGSWTERPRWVGRGLAGRTVGLIGLGSVATVLISLLAPLQTEIIVADPYRSIEDAARLGVELVGLDQLLERSDVVVVLCPLTPETYHLVGAPELERMKPSARLVNVARGPIVDQDALVEALRRGTIAGAGLDVFEQEPLPADHPLTGLPNVSLSPHGLAQTDQMLDDTAASAVRSIVDVSHGRVPRLLANRDVLAHPTLTQRLEALREFSTS